jgi:hypothetical protein
VVGAAGLLIPVLTAGAGSDPTLVEDASSYKLFDVVCEVGAGLE